MTQDNLTMTGTLGQYIVCACGGLSCLRLLAASISDEYRAISAVDDVKRKRGAVRIGFLKTMEGGEINSGMRVRDGVKRRWPLARA